MLRRIPWCIVQPPQRTFSCQFLVISRHCEPKQFVPIWYVPHVIVSLGPFPVLRIPAPKFPVDDCRELSSPDYNIPQGQISVGEATSVSAGVTLRYNLTKYLGAFLEWDPPPKKRMKRIVTLVWTITRRPNPLIETFAEIRGSDLAVMWRRQTSELVDVTGELVDDTTLLLGR